MTLHARLHASLLQHHTYFEQCDMASLLLFVQKGNVLHVPDARYIYQAGQNCDAFYVILSGGIQVIAHDESQQIVLEKLLHGKLLGIDNVCNFDSWQHSAKAFGKTTLLAFKKQDLQALQVSTEKSNRLTKTSTEEINYTSAFSAIEKLISKNNTAHSPYLRAYDQDAIIFYQGDSPDGMYWLQKGKVEVFTTVDDKHLHICTLGEGSCFGELGIINNAPRSASIRAVEDVELIFVPTQHFINCYENDPLLKKYFEILCRKRGVMTQYHEYIKQEGEYYVTYYDLPDGRQLITKLAVDLNRYIIEQTKPETNHTISDYITYDDNMYTIELTFIENKLIRAICNSNWPQLQRLHEAVLENKNFSDKEMEEFKKTGLLFQDAVANGTSGYRDQDLICHCMKITYGNLKSACATGLNTLKTLQNELGCCTVCGGCRMAILELLGDTTWHPIKFIEKKEHLNDVRSYKFKIIDKKHYTHSYAGQHIFIRANIKGHLVQRPYTLTSPADQADHFEVVIKKEPKGIFSNWIFNTDDDSIQLEASKPQGDYFWEHHEASPVVCFVAGIGVAPAISMLRTKKERNKKTPIYIHYSVLSKDRVIYEALLNQHQDSYRVTITIRETNIEGRLDSTEVKNIVAENPDAEFYICGPDSYNDDIHDMLVLADVPEKSIHVEEFIHQGDTSQKEVKKKQADFYSGKHRFFGHTELVKKPFHTTLRKAYKSTGKIFKMQLWLKEFTVIGGIECNELIKETPNLLLQSKTYRPISKVQNTSHCIIASDHATHRKLRTQYQDAFSIDKLTTRKGQQLFASIQMFCGVIRSQKTVNANNLLWVASILSSQYILDYTPNHRQMKTLTKLNKMLHLERTMLYPWSGFNWLPQNLFLKHKASKIADEIISALESTQIENCIIDNLLKNHDEFGRKYCREALRAAVLTPFTIDNYAFAATLETLLFYLHRDEELQKIAKDDADKLFSDSLHHANIKKTAKHIYATALEVLRLHPFYTGIFGYADKDFMFKGHEVRQDTLVFAYGTATHFEDAFYKNPNDFIWDRFLDKAEPINDLYYRPFGISSHMCLGREFTLHLLTLAAAGIINQFNLKLKFTDYKACNSLFHQLRGKPIIIEQ